MTVNEKNVRAAPKDFDVDELIEEEAEIEAEKQLRTPAIGVVASEHGEGSCKISPKKISDTDQFHKKSSSESHLDLDSLLDEEAEIEAENENKQNLGPDGSAGSGKNDKIETCNVCDRPNIDNKIFSHFRIPLCYECKSTDPKYKMMTKTRAKSEYLLNDKILDDLPWMEINNPRHGAWSRMKLFMTVQVEVACIKKYGSIHSMEEIRDKRVKQRIEKQQKKKGTQPGENILSSAIAKLRKSLLSSDDRASTCNKTVTPTSQEGIGQVVSTQAEKGRKRSRKKAKETDRKERRKRKKEKKGDNKAKGTSTRKRLPRRHHSHTFGPEQHMGADTW
eukprot:CAMPEP_0184012598 /NCGR_PEP_ID=MMETSP0954-20121128/4514_1 /TAXON_ID=627963 /ORGANISM="Aplanochytrium sp, Strain PBS07" /LENGTH=333 /DNA_ID=CAMNT_0026292629 /DNA_START=218 /DNA_END=1216 /DNA_ORIENTATION=+